MLFLHELHTVSGRHEDAFELAIRDGYMPELARTDDARLLYYVKLAHGTGRAYQVITITGIRDGAAYGALAERVQRGSLRSWSADADSPSRSPSGGIPTRSGGWRRGSWGRGTRRPGRASGRSSAT